MAAEIEPVLTTVPSDEPLITPHDGLEALAALITAYCVNGHQPNPDALGALDAAVRFTVLSILRDHSTIELKLRRACAVLRCGSLVESELGPDERETLQIAAPVAELVYKTALVCGAITEDS